MGAWHRSTNRRTDVGILLPDLLVDCQDTVAGLDDGAARRDANAVLADAYHLAQHVLVNAAPPDLLWLVVERAMAAAQAADRPLALAGAAWTVGNMLRMDGRMEEALALVHEAAHLLEPQLPDGGDEWRAMWGAPQLHGAVTAARAGRDGEAWAHWDRANHVLRRLPAGYRDHWTAFGEGNVRLHEVSLTVDLWKSREALRRAESIDPQSRRRCTGWLSAPSPRAAVVYAAEHGASVVEGYPVADAGQGKKAGLSSGTIGLFTRSGFTMHLCPATGRRVVMRRPV